MGLRVLRRGGWSRNPGIWGIPDVDQDRVYDGIRFGGLRADSSGVSELRGLEGSGRKWRGGTLPGAPELCPWQWEVRGVSMCPGGLGAQQILVIAIFVIIFHL